MSATLVVCSFGTFAATSNTGQWFLDFPSNSRQDLQFGIHRDHSQSSFSVSRDNFRGLGPNATHFEFVRDAGTFVCDGRFEGDHGAGTFVFHPSADYAQAMRSMGYEINPDDQIDLAVFDVSRTFVRDLDALGYNHLPIEDLKRLRIHGVTTAWIREFQNAGYKSLRAEDLVRLRIHGAQPEFARELTRAGYGTVPVEDLIRMRIHGVSPEYIHDFDTLGYQRIPIEDLIRMRIHGVTPESVRKVEAAGFKHPSTEELIRMRIHGVIE
jgi:hypothetical protein